jgi:hypothetical protein
MTTATFSKKLNQFLSSGKTVTLLFIVALICRAESALFGQDFNSDKETQIIAAKSLLEAKGVTLPNAKSADVSLVEYKTYYQWPRGYSVYFAGIYYFVRNIFWAAFLLDLLAILLYFFSWRWLIGIFSEDSSNRNFAFSIFLILTAFSNTPFDYLKSSDLIALSFYLFSLGCLFSSDEGRRGWILFFMGLAAICFAIYTRYAYIPVSFVLMAAFLIIFYKNRKKIFITRFVIGVIVFALFTQFANHSSEAPAFRNESLVSGYNVNALSKFYYMFPVQSIIASNTTHSITKVLHGKGETICMALLCLLILGVFAWSFRNVVREWFSTARVSPSVIIIIISLASAIISILLLIYMTLTRPTQKNDVLDNWTYVEEKRYYVIFWMTMLMSFSFTIMHDNGKLRKIILVIFFLVFLIEIPYFLYNKYVLISKNNSYFVTGDKKFYFLQFPKDIEQRTQIERDYDKLSEIIHASTKKNGFKPLYLSADRSERIAVLEGAVFGLHGLVDTAIFASQAQTLIIKLSDNDPYPNQDLRAFIKSNHLNSCYSGEIGTLYICMISRHGITADCDLIRN